MSNQVVQEKTNRLIDEKSPYLLQHAHNPVNWYPWGDEAFEKAKLDDKPIFLSIGYSTCHWCHVMERESFEDNQAAEVLNKYFISIKVDREERPDIDHIYMTVCQALTGSGGWPLTIIMTPDKKPFFAGTYFPKNDRMGMMGLISILESVRKAWADNRDQLLSSSSQILSLIKQQDNISGKELSSDVIQEAFSQFEYDFDKVYGGFGDAPKFPTPHNLSFLLRYWYKTKDKTALEIVEKTLDSMYRGGIYDHIGFGFSRYSTDRKWLVPHFEKMLYDNALLAIAYLETYQITKNKKYSDVALQIFTYILRDMTSEEGGFFSAEDADSEGEEGKFYVWSDDEIKLVLGNQEGNKFCEYFNITPKGNFEGKNIPNLINSHIKETDQEFIKSCRGKLFKYREKRIHPYKDDKILTSWNGLMIAAMAIGGRALGNNEYIIASEKAASFIFKNLIRKDGRLLARYRSGDAAFPAYIDDYAFLIWGLIELYETTYNSEYLQKAVNLNNDLIKYFWDSQNGGLFVYGSDSEQLITRPKEIYDGATPSGNSVSALNFLRLARLTGMYDLEEKALELLKSFGKSIESYPKGHSYALTALLFINSPGKEIVIASDNINEETKKMTGIINEEFRPFAVSLLYTAETKDIENLVPFITDYKSVNGKPAAYVCEKFSCQAPVTDSGSFNKMLIE
ncbi:MAG: thioredoxin domain-containing protein [Clostridiaceae bacterium]